MEGLFLTLSFESNCLNQNKFKFSKSQVCQYCLKITVFVYQLFSQSCKKKCKKVFKKKNLDTGYGVC